MSGRLSAPAPRREEALAMGRRRGSEAEARCRGAGAEMPAVGTPAPGLRRWFWGAGAEVPAQKR